MHFLPCGLHLKINLCCQIFRLWIDHWLCNTGSPIMTIFWDSKNYHYPWSCVTPSGQQSEPNCQNGRGTLTLKKESVFSRQALSHKAFLWKASNPILALRNLKKNGAWSVVTDHNRSPWRRSNQNQRQKLWSSSIEDHRFWSPETAWYISTTLCTYRTCFGHWTESWLKRTSVTSCDQCWWQHWELNRRRVLFNDSLPSVGMSYYKRTGNQDGGSCDGSELQSDFGAHCHQVWFWGWLETAKQKRHILDGMEGPFLFCCVTWKQQLLCFCPGQLLCGVPCG